MELDDGNKNIFKNRYKVLFNIQEAPAHTSFSHRPSQAEVLQKIKEGKVIKDQRS